MISKAENSTDISSTAKADYIQKFVDEIMLAKKSCENPSEIATKVMSSDPNAYNEVMTQFQEKFKEKMALMEKNKVPYENGNSTITDNEVDPAEFGWVDPDYTDEQWDYNAFDQARSVFNVEMKTVGEEKIDKEKIRQTISNSALYQKIKNGELQEFMDSDEFDTVT